MPGRRRGGSANTGLRRTGLTGMAIGALAIVLCELPIVLAIAGLGGLGAGLVAFRPPPVVEIAAAVLVVAGAVLWLAVRLKRPATGGEGE